MENIVKQVDSTFLYIIGLSFLLLLLVTGVMIYFLIRYRQAGNPGAADIRGNAALELAWMIVPALIALFMFYVGWQSFLGLRGVPRDALDIRATGVRFAWVFYYPTGKRSEGLLVVPLGRPVKITLTSLDVIHGFSVPAFRIKMDAVPKMKTYAWFYAGMPGTYKIFCSRYCGAGDAAMMADLRVVTQKEYLDWLRKK